MFKKSFEKLKAALKKTRDILFMDVRDVFKIGRKVDQDLLDQLEEIMVKSDMGVDATTEILAELKEAYRDKVIEDPKGIVDFLKTQVRATLTKKSIDISRSPTPPTVILVAGVNGTGKTTSIAKLAHHFRRVEGKSVLLAACDTFRAAAVEQLEVWAGRIGAEIVKRDSGTDPAAVAVDAAQMALARKFDVLIVDTAGRLHTSTNLMKQLEKIRRVIEQRIPGAPHETLLVLDATTGQNAISQAKMFYETVKVDGIFLAKLDGTAKGGVVVAINRQLDVPVKFIGVGEGVEDIEPFDPDRFVEALFAE
ncbi:MAG: signal recognition particle-docking protein FtsY [Planctomycetes bacterium]|nr:signal recognition particle-docking protein FtsY [Planctomycetota bacterium]